MTKNTTRRAAAWPVYLVFFLLIAFGLIFVFEFVEVNQNPTVDESAPTLTEDTYLAVVTPLLVSADPEHGNELINQYECGACHRVAANRIAPSFEGLAERATTRRPPLAAAAYIYESITQPGAYVVEGYADAMLKNYPDRLSDRDLGDIIAYLLLPDAQ